MIKVLYFARIAELTGTRQEQVDLAQAQISADVLAALQQRHPALATVKNLKMAVNQSHARPDTPIKSGDEVALFEPVTGG